MVAKSEALEALEEAIRQLDKGDVCDTEHARGLIAKAAVYLHQPQPVPEGFVLVPVEPTREMLIDGTKAARDFLSEAGQYPRSRAVYRAMLATAPNPGGTSDGDETAGTR